MPRPIDRRRGSEDLSLVVEDQIRKSLATILEPGSVVEVRAFGDRRGVKAGYYDHPETLVKDAAELDRQGWEVYMTLNPVNRDLLARAANRIKDGPKVTTSDKDISHRRWLLVDIDCVRPSEVSATKPEKKAAFERAKEVRGYLRGKGWPEPVIADSGNGFHLLYGVDQPNDQKSRNLVKDVLEALAFRFDDERVKIDTSVHNAARIVRLYGTKARKGDHTPERPHRRSRIIKTPEEVQ